MRSVCFYSFGKRIPNCAVGFYALKLAVIVLAFSLLSYSSVFAYQLTFEWDPNVEEDLAGYIVHYGTASRDYSYDVDVGDFTTTTISGLYSGVTYYFAVTAYDIEGNESAYSNEVSYPNISGSSGGGGGGG